MDRRTFLKSAPVALMVAPLAIEACPVVPTIADRIAALKAVLEAETGTTWALVDGLENAGTFSLIDMGWKPIARQYELGSHFAKVAIRVEQGVEP